MVMATGVMTEPAFFVLTALADAPRHGYGIVGEVAKLSNARVQLKIGTLYGVLDRLVGDGLIEPDHDEVYQGRLRRYYRLTQPGSRALAAEAERQAANARAAARRLRARRAADAGSAT
jgi:DNA-binding PadR family transcriptional regulator